MNGNSLQPTVFIVDDNEVVRDFIRCLLESMDLRTRMFSSADDFLSSCDMAQEGCILLDMRMPGMSGMELLEHLKNKGSHLPVIIMTLYGDVPMAVRAFKQGVFDFIEKPFNNQGLLDTVNAALKLNQESRRRYCDLESQLLNLEKLTGREREIMERVVAGNSSKTIGKELGISPRTVDIHRSNTMKKLNIRNIAELVQSSVGRGKKH